MKGQFRSKEQRILQANRRREQFRAQRTGKPDFRLEMDGDEAVVWIYDFIDFLGVLADEVVPMLAEIDAPTIRVRINSPGGDVFDGFAIYNALRQHRSNVIVQVDGVAASAASVVAVAGDEVLMADASFLMIHNAWGMVIGNADELRDAADLLDKVDGQIADAYARKSGSPAADFASAMAVETWYTQDEAIDAGLADGTIDVEKVEDLFDLSAYTHLPQALRDAVPGAKSQDAPPERRVEKALRDAGFSRREAKAMAAGLASLSQRDADGVAEAVEAGKGLAATMRRKP